MPIEISSVSSDFPRLILQGETVCWGQAAAEPLTLTEALIAARAAIGGFNAFVGMGWSGATDPAFADHINYLSYCAAGTTRKVAAAGQLDILPSHYSALEAALAARIDVLLLHLPPAGSDGHFSFGLASEYLAPLVKSARLVVAEVNDKIPATTSEPAIAPEDIDFIVRTSRPLAEPVRVPPNSAEQAIGKYIADRIEDGAVLQIGLGSIPEAALRSLSGHRELGVHSGLINDTVAELSEAGVITNARKPFDTGISVTGLLAGGAHLMRFADGNPKISVRPTSYTHAPDILARLQRLTAINSAIEVDLTGQINAEVAGSRYVGAVGGSIDFLRGAHRADRGLPMIALPATVATRDGVRSRIVARLSGPVTTSRADAGIIVTEYGLVDLRGLTINERINKMLNLAAPEFREELARQAVAMR